MSLTAIQDTIVKAPLVQQTQTKSDDVARGQEIGQAVAQKEQSRQADQVVLHSHESREGAIRDDDERDEFESSKKKKKNGQGGDDDEEDEKKRRPKVVRIDDDEDDDGHPRAKMKRLNFFV